MGFPYGLGLYGKGIYSRKFGWWRDTTCHAQTWAAGECKTNAGSSTSTRALVVSSRREAPKVVGQRYG